MKRFVWKRMVLRRLVFIVAAFALSACAALRDNFSAPEVGLANLRMGPGGGMQQTVFVDLVIANPNSVPLKFNAITYRVRIEGRDLVSGTSREPLEIAAGATQKYTVPATVSLRSGFSLIRDLMSKPKNKIAYELNASLEPSGLFALPITVKKADVISLQ